MGIYGDKESAAAYTAALLREFNKQNAEKETASTFPLAFGGTAFSDKKIEKAETIQEAKDKFRAEFSDQSEEILDLVDKQVKGALALELARTEISGDELFDSLCGSFSRKDAAEILDQTKPAKNYVLAERLAKHEITVADLVGLNESHKTGIITLANAFKEALDNGKKIESSYGRTFDDHIGAWAEGGLSRAYGIPESKQTLAAQLIGKVFHASNEYKFAQGYNQENNQELNQEQNQHREPEHPNEQDEKEEIYFDFEKGYTAEDVNKYLSDTQEKKNAIEKLLSDKKSRQIILDADEYLSRAESSDNLERFLKKNEYRIADVERAVKLAEENGIPFDELRAELRKRKNPIERFKQSRRPNLIAMSDNENTGSESIEPRKPKNLKERIEQWWRPDVIIYEEEIDYIDSDFGEETDKIEELDEPDEEQPERKKNRQKSFNHKNSFKSKSGGNKSKKISFDLENLLESSETEPEVIEVEPAESKQSIVNELNELVSALYQHSEILAKLTEKILSNKSGSWGTNMDPRVNELKSLCERLKMDNYSLKIIDPKNIETFFKDNSEFFAAAEKIDNTNASLSELTRKIFDEKAGIDFSGIDPKKIEEFKALVEKNAEDSYQLLIRKIKVDDIMKAAKTKPQGTEMGK